MITNPYALALVMALVAGTLFPRLGFFAIAVLLVAGTSSGAVDNLLRSLIGAAH